MRKYLIHDAFNIYEFSASVWNHPVHRHTYYEMIFILKGSGVHHLNGRDLAYGTGSFFFLGPDDYHFFSIHRETQFCFIRFTAAFANEGNSFGKDSFARLIKTFNSNDLISIPSKTERNRLFSLMNILRDEYANRYNRYYANMRDAIMFGMLSIIARNASGTTGEPMTVATGVIDELIQHVRENVSDPGELSIEVLAAKMGFAPSYISILFKRHTGESLKSYIVQYRLKVIEARLLYSNMSLSEIADEFQFTDESHLCRQFKKYKGITPTSFRNHVKVGTGDKG